MTLIAVLRKIGRIVGWFIIMSPIWFLLLCVAYIVYDRHHAESLDCQNDSMGLEDFQSHGDEYLASIQKYRDFDGRSFFIYLDDGTRLKPKFGKEGSLCGLSDDWSYAFFREEFKKGWGIGTERSYLKCPENSPMQKKLLEMRIGDSVKFGSGRTLLKVGNGWGMVEYPDNGRYAHEYAKSQCGH